MLTLLVWYVYISSPSRSMCMADHVHVHDQVHVHGSTHTVFLCTQRRELCHSDVEGLTQGCQSKGRVDGAKRIREEEDLGAAMWVPVCGQKWQTGRRGLTRKQSSKSRDCRLGWNQSRICSPNALAYTAVNRIGGARGVDQPPFDPFTSKRARNKAAKQCLNRVWWCMLAIPLLGHQRQEELWVSPVGQPSQSHEPLAQG